MFPGVSLHTSDGLLDRYAHLLNALGGRFSTGEDLGTSPADMLRIRWNPFYDYVEQRTLEFLPLP